MVSCMDEVRAVPFVGIVEIMLRENEIVRRLGMVPDHGVKVTGSGEPFFSSVEGGE